MQRSIAMEAAVGLGGARCHSCRCAVRVSLAVQAKQAVKEEGMVGYRFNTIGVSDGISMGTRGEPGNPLHGRLLTLPAGGSRRARSGVR